MSDPSSLPASFPMTTDGSNVGKVAPSHFSVKLVKAFVQPDGSHGNGAGVVLLSEANHLKSTKPEALVSNGRFPSDSDCLKIAKWVGLPETSFVLFPKENDGDDVADGSKEKADFHVKWFTPECEVDMCGHATVALAGYIHSINKGSLQQNRHFWRMHCKSGLLGIEVTEGVRKDSFPRVVMEQAIPEFCGVVDYNEIASSLSIDIENDLAITSTDGNGDEHNKSDDKSMKQVFPFPHCEIVSTGGRDLMIPMRSTVLNEMDILGNGNQDGGTNDLKREQLCHDINVVSKRYNIVGYHIFEVDDDLFRSKINSDNEIIEAEYANGDLCIHLNKLIRIYQEASKTERSVVESCLEAVGIKRLDSYDREKTTMGDTSQKSKTIHVTGVRNFAPFVGIPEEPATGSANGALACYLVKHLFLDVLHRSNGNRNRGCFDFPVWFRFCMEQGRAMGEPCLIDVEIEVLNNEIRMVKVGGLVNVTGDSLNLDLISI